MQKSFFLKAGVFVIALMISQLALAKAVGSVTFKTGDATITHADKSVVQAAKNTELNAGDTVETKDGRLQLALIDGGKVSLQPNTIYKINKYEFSGKEDGTEYAFTELIKGGLRTVSGLVGHKNRDRYQLKTTAATIGIRGTEFTVNFNDNILLMTTNHGSVDVCNQAGCLNATTGQSIEVNVGGAPKFSKKTAQAAAAAPTEAAQAVAAAPSGKAVFSAGEEVALVAPVAPTPAVLPASGTVVSLAIPTGGGTVFSEVITGDIAYDSSNNVTQVSTSTGKIIKPLAFAATNSSDGIISWGQATGGTYSAAGTSTGMSRYDYIAGATPNLAGRVGTATYNVFGSTAPYLVSGASVNTIGLANAIPTSSFLKINFDNYTFVYGIVVPTIANGDFNLSGKGGLTPAGTLSSNGTVTNTASACGTTGCSGGLGGGNLLLGSLIGLNAERAGFHVGISAPGLNGIVYTSGVAR